MKDAGIVRNRLKIESAVTNAKAFLEVQKEFGSFSAYAWKFVDGKPIRLQARRPGSGANRNLGCAVQGPEAPGLQVRRLDHHVRFHAGDRHGERPCAGLLSCQEERAR